MLAWLGRATQSHASSVRFNGWAHVYTGYTRYSRFITTSTLESSGEKDPLEIQLVYGTWNDPYVVINKPAGIPVSSSQRDCVEKRIQSIVGQHRPVLPVHRLDKHTSGLLLVALDHIAASQLQTALQLQSIYGTELLETELEPELASGTETQRGPPWATTVPVSTRDQRRSELARRVAPQLPWEKRYRVLVDLPPCVQANIQTQSEDQNPVLPQHPAELLASTQVLPRQNHEVMKVGKFQLARMIDANLRLRSSGLTASYMTRRRMLPLFWESKQVRATTQHLSKIAGYVSNRDLLKRYVGQKKELQPSDEDATSDDDASHLDLDSYDAHLPAPVDESSSSVHHQHESEVEEDEQVPYYVPDMQETVWKYLPDHTVVFGANTQGFAMPAFKDSFELADYVTSKFGRVKDIETEAHLKRIVVNEGTKKERNKRNKLRKKARKRDDPDEAVPISIEQDPSDIEAAATESTERPAFDFNYVEAEDFATGRRSLTSSDLDDASHLNSTSMSDCNDRGDKALMVFDRPTPNRMLARRALCPASSMALVEGAPTPPSDTDKDSNDDEVAIASSTTQLAPWGWINNRLTEFDRRLHQANISRKQVHERNDPEPYDVFTLQAWMDRRLILPRLLGNGLIPADLPGGFLERRLSMESERWLQPQLPCGCIIPHDSFRKPVRLVTKSSDGDEKETWLYDRPHPFVPETTLFESTPKCHAALHSHILAGESKLKDVVERARLAATEYRLIGVYPEQGRALYSARLHSGRSHQIRVHFAGNGLPLTGDPYYNLSFIRSWWQRYASADRIPPPRPSIPTLGLQAYFLQFPVAMNTGYSSNAITEDHRTWMSEGKEALKRKLLRKTPNLTTEELESILNQPRSLQWMKKHYLRTRNAQFKAKPEEVNPVTDRITVHDEFDGTANWKALSEKDDLWLDSLVGNSDSGPTEANLGIYSVTKIMSPPNVRIWRFKAGKRGYEYLRIMLQVPKSWNTLLPKSVITEY